MWKCENNRRRGQVLITFSLYNSKIEIFINIDNIFVIIIFRFKTVAEGKTHKLLISKATTHDSKEYTCTFKNADTSAKLKVNGNQHSPSNY